MVGGVTVVVVVVVQTYDDETDHETIREEYERE